MSKYFTSFNPSCNYHLLLVILTALITLNITTNKDQSLSLKQQKQEAKLAKKETIQKLKILFKKRSPKPGKPGMGRGAALLLKILLFSFFIIIPLLAIGLTLFLVANLTSITSIGLLILGIALGLLYALILVVLMNKKKWKKKRKSKKN